MSRCRATTTGASRSHPAQTARDGQDGGGHDCEWLGETDLLEPLKPVNYALTQVAVNLVRGPQLLLAWQGGVYGTCRFVFGFVDVRRDAA